MPPLVRSSCVCKQLVGLTNQLGSKHSLEPCSHQELSFGATVQALRFPSCTRGCLSWTFSSHLLKSLNTQDTILRHILRWEWMEPLYTSKGVPAPQIEWPSCHFLLFMARWGQCVVKACSTRRTRWGLGLSLQLGHLGSWEFWIYIYIPTKVTKTENPWNITVTIVTLVCSFLVIRLMIGTEASRFGPVGGRGASAAKTMDVSPAWF